MALSAELILLTVMLMNKKSDTSYLAMCFFLLCAFAAFDADRGRRSNERLLCAALVAGSADRQFLVLAVEPGVCRRNCMRSGYPAIETHGS